MSDLLHFVTTPDTMNFFRSKNTKQPREESKDIRDRDNNYDKGKEIMHGCIAPAQDEFEQFYGCS